MKLFIDSSDLDEIREALQYGVSGVTTNPTTMAKAAEGWEARAQEICRVAGYDRPVSIQVTETTRGKMQYQASKIKDLAENTIVKVPATNIGLSNCWSLSRYAHRFNVTLIFSPTQALIAAQSGAWCVSPFLCRWRDYHGIENKWWRAAGVQFLRSIVNAVQGTDCKVLAASIRSPEDVEDAIEAGCDIATVSLKVLKQMMQHPKTDEGLAKFMQDWEAGQAVAK